MKQVHKFSDQKCRSAQRLSPRSFLFSRRNVEDFRKAVSYFDEAIRLDPDYALAYAERSEAWSFIGDLNPGHKWAAWAEAKSDAEKAVAIAPFLAEAQAALGGFVFFSIGNSPKA